jgi:hypothetical protein
MNQMTAAKQRASGRMNDTGQPARTVARWLPLLAAAHALAVDASEAGPLAAVVRAALLPVAAAGLGLLANAVARLEAPVALAACTHVCMLRSLIG